MRVLHLPSSHLPDTIGGTETYVDQLCRGMLAAGHEAMVAVHTSAPRAQAESEIPYPIHRLPVHAPRRRRDIYERSADREPPGFARLLENTRPDLVHFHALTLGAGHDHAAEAKRQGIPFLLTYHTPAISCPRGTMLHLGTEPCDGAMVADRCAACTLESRGWSPGLANLAARSPLAVDWLPDGPWIPRLSMPDLLAQSFNRLRQFFGDCAHIVACANWCKDLLIRNGVQPAKITVLRQAIAGATRHRQLRLPIAGKQPIKLGYFGRVCQIKGPDVLVEAVPILRARGVDATCELVGPVQADEHDWFAGVLQRREGVRHLGVLRGDELTRWLDGLDLLAIPSRWLETGPLTLLESWDRGLPAIGSNRGGIADFLAAAGLQECAFEVDSPKSLADAVERMRGWSRPSPVVEVRGFEQLTNEMVFIYERAVATARAA